MACFSSETLKQQRSFCHFRFPAAGFGFVNPKPTQFAAPPPPTNPPEILTDDIPDISTSSTDEDLLAGYRRPGGGPLAGRGSSTIFRKQEESYQGLGFLTDSRSKMQTLAQEADVSWNIIMFGFSKRETLRKQVFEIRGSKTGLK